MGLYTQVSDVCQATQACLYAGFYWGWGLGGETYACLLYTSDAADES